MKYFKPFKISILFLCLNLNTKGGIHFIKNGYFDRVHSIEFSEDSVKTIYPNEPTQKPPLHSKNYMAITGKPLAAMAGARIFEQGGNAVDAAVAMIAATCTMWDVLSWGGETQALIYNPKTKKIIAINGLGYAPEKATIEFYKSKGFEFPPEYGPLAAVTPGTFGGICLMLAHYGTKSLKDVLSPALDLAKGYPIDAQTANSIEKNKAKIKEWDYSKKVFLPHLGSEREAPEPGEIFVQTDLANTLEKLIKVEQKALKQGKSRQKAIWEAFDEFYKGEIAQEIVRSTNEMGGIISLNDLAEWQPQEEEPIKLNYKGVDIFKLNTWTQGPMMLQALNIIENFDLSQFNYNSPQYINLIYQCLTMAMADRDFYYGDPKYSKVPLKGLLSKEYAKERSKLIDLEKANTHIGPGNPYPYQNEVNPYQHLLLKRELLFNSVENNSPKSTASESNYFVPENLSEIYFKRLTAGTTTVEATDKDGWIVSVTPSGGWIPAVIAGKTGIGLSQRLQSFVLDSALGPNNLLEPHKQPRVTLTPSLAFKNDSPYLCFGVQGGDTQDQNLFQFFLNIFHYKMTVQQACEAPNINTNQLMLSLGGDKLIDRQPHDQEIVISYTTSEQVKNALIKMNYKLKPARRTSGPINAIFFDTKHKTFWGGSSNNGEDYGIGW